MDQYAGYNNTPSMPFPLHNQPNNFSFANPNPGFPQYNNYQFENDNLMNNFPNRPNILPNPLLPFPQGMPGMGMPLQQPPLPGLGLVQPPVNLNAVKKSRVVGRVPCQWFNTPNGCSWGDKCTFAVSHIYIYLQIFYLTFLILLAQCNFCNWRPEQTRSWRTKNGSWRTMITFFNYLYMFIKTIYLTIEK
jgi:hypothetical protein